MVEESISHVVQRYLAALQEEGIRAQLGVIFGSHVRGTTDLWSDIDVLVVAPEFDPPRQRRDVDRLWHVAARTDSRIEPFPCGSQQWKSDNSSTILEIARREGQQVTS